jgi:hypothetical protein
METQILWYPWLQEHSLPGWLGTWEVTTSILLHYWNPRNQL